jgi:hypothetical protein
MITPEGVIKVLDFGLAAVAPSSGGESHAVTNSRTLRLSPTTAGAEAIENAMRCWK